MSSSATAPQPSPPDSSPVEREVGRIRELTNQRQFLEALSATQTLSAEVPENRDVLYLMALNQRQLHRMADAFDTLERLERLHPRFSRLHQERGHCYVFQKDAPRAIDAFLRAVNINPALPTSWSLLEGLYRLVGQPDNAATAAAHVVTLQRLPPEVVQATSLFSDGDLAPAESIIRAYLLKHGNHVEAMRLLARIGQKREVLDDAELLLEAVLQLAPDYQAARYDYAQVLLDRHKYALARRELETLLASDAANPQYRTLFATSCVGLGEHDRAIGLYRELLQHSPRAADLHLSIAHSLKTQGCRQEAIDSYHAAAAMRPNYGDAYWSLANLKTYRFTDVELGQMRTGEAAAGIATVDRYHLCFALGKALEDRGEFAESWRYYERGNALKRAEIRYRPTTFETNTRRQIEVCTSNFFAERAQSGVASEEPIFIIGLPRSGSTLLEQILASHSQVEGTQELPDIPRIALELQGRVPNFDDPRYPGVLAQMESADFRRLAGRYLSDTRIYRTEKPRFVDKMPNNFRHVGLIHLLLPNARIIDARREPMACCFSNLKQLFATGQEFTYSIEDIARYYRTYLELMQHWDRVLPGRVLRIRHEDVVDDLEANVRRILDFCGLPFERACVDFHRTERSVRTASSEQVRQPIFREGLDQWKNYQPWLDPLRNALGDALDRYRL
ncbi:MAG: sulfotransferase [Steroidobacteraceae bacterium]